ncbi:type VI secretion system baseplate subunit TssF [uncultured Desulfobulbus sp.]|uniref:type VI secretion system baseplate subunit TssF n=1 Tax=uncultured Desulfobulbus sp. TaxID=239745 RepID=UPI0029C7310B|nr:type VI secretion system baseplate subunit TssF [uncultured Desulfobulbus sp.]
MDDTLLSYYEQELTYIRELGAEFGRKYPKIAGRLLLEADKSEDLHVERLIEAFAFISGRIHKKIDDDFPEITQSLLNIIYPHYVAPIPSMAIVQFDPIRQNISEAGYAVPRDTAIFSSSVAGAPCSFRTCMPVEIWPVEVTQVAFKDPDFARKDDARLVLQIDLASYNNISLSDLGWKHLRFYLNGQAHHVFELYELLLNNVVSVEMETMDEQGKQIGRLTLPADVIRPAAFEDEEALLPFTGRSFPGYRLLFEYFSFPEKFLFLDLHSLDQLRQIQANQAVTINIYLNRIPKTKLAVDRETLVCNGAPVVNLFQRIAEPIRVEHSRPEYQVIPDIRRSNAIEIFSLDRIVSTGGSAGEEGEEFKPFYSIRHHLAETENLRRQVFWHSKRRASAKKGDNGTDVYLSFVDLNFKPTDPAVEVLMAKLTCTNRDLPGKLPFGDPNGDFTLEIAAPIRAIRCLSKPTPTRRPSLEGGLQWRLISHLSLNYLSLVEGGEEALREILQLYDFEDSPSTKQQISGIVAISAKHVTRRLGRSICRGVRITLELDQENFVGAGMYLFASILERFFGQYVSVNSFSQLVVITSKDKKVVKEWPPRSGQRVLL